MNKSAEEIDLNRIKVQSQSVQKIYILVCNYKLIEE